MRAGALAALMLLVALLLGGLSLAMKLGADFVPTFMVSQEYWLAMGAFLALLIGALSRSSRRS